MPPLTEEPPYPMFEPGARVRTQSGVADPATFTVVVGIPDANGDIVVVDDEGEYWFRSSHSLGLVPAFPRVFASVYPHGIGMSNFDTLSLAIQSAKRGHGCLGVLELHPDGSTTMHEVE